MAKETKEQKELRRVAEEHAAMVAKENFRKTMPKRLMEIEASAVEGGVSTRIFLTETGPGVEFTRYQYDQHCNDFEETLTYDSDEWVVDFVERRIRDFKEEIEARRRRVDLANRIWSNLTDDEKKAFKENLERLD